MKISNTLFLCFIIAILFGIVSAANIVPTDVELPGTQPLEIGNLESPDKCDNCHGGYNTSIEPAHNWRGSMMGNAGRDPLFWATVAIAEQDFDGVGDLCIRCHSTAGWIEGRSTPTDGSGLQLTDTNGVDCDYCHKLTNPDGKEIPGVQFPPFLANDEEIDPTAYFGSGMGVLSGDGAKLGPYADDAARHRSMQSNFHRSVDYCGTCHDVSNSVVGDLAHNNGTLELAGPVAASGIPGGPIESKAAFRNFPFQYGIVERTFSEFKSGGLSAKLVSEYDTLPEDLKAGAVKVAYESALLAGTGGNYEDGTGRHFSCQTCHMRPVNGAGCNKKGAPVRKDLPLHDMTGGNYWIPDAIIYLDGLNRLRLGGGLTDVQTAALNDGKIRAMKQLSEAATLNVVGNTLKVINHTGHKLISGYPEGRRMWLNIKWYDSNNVLVQEEGAYGTVDVLIDGVQTSVETILDPEHTRIYEAHYGMTQEWARQLIALGYSPDMVLGYDRLTGEVDETLGDLATESPGESEETFHFVLNNIVIKDNRIPPYQMHYDAAKARNALPVPASLYGNPDPGGVYNYWDEVSLSPPDGAMYAKIQLMYQPTSWEYIQFLYLAGNGENTFLANEGAALLDAWLNTGMATPYIMASATWGEAPVPATPRMVTDYLETWEIDRKGNLIGASDVFSKSSNVGILAHVVDENGNPVSGAQVFVEVLDPNGILVDTIQGFSDESGDVLMKWKTSRKQETGRYTVNVVDIIISSYVFDPELSGGIVSISLTVQ